MCYFLRCYLSLSSLYNMSDSFTFLSLDIRWRLSQPWRWVESFFHFLVALDFISLRRRHDWRAINCRIRMNVKWWSFTTSKLSVWDNYLNSGTFPWASMSRLHLLTFLFFAFSARNDQARSIIASNCIVLLTLAKFALSQLWNWLFSFLYNDTVLWCFFIRLRQLFDFN